MMYDIPMINPIVIATMNIISSLLSSKLSRIYSTNFFTLNILDTQSKNILSNESICKSKSNIYKNTQY